MPYGMGDRRDNSDLVGILLQEGKVDPQEAIDLLVTQGDDIFDSKVLNLYKDFMTNQLKDEELETALDKFLKKAGVNENLQKQKEQLNCGLAKPLDTDPVKMNKVEETALRYNEGKIEWGLLNYKALEPMIQVLMFGAKKYAPNNWKKGLSKRQILESMQRHLAALMDEEENDPESGISHIGHIGCNYMFYSYFTTVDTSKARE